MSVVIVTTAERLRALQEHLARDYSTPLVREFLQDCDAAKPAAVCASGRPGENNRVSEHERSADIALLSSLRDDLQRLGYIPKKPIPQADGDCRQHDDTNHALALF